MVEKRAVDEWEVFDDDEAQDSNHVERNDLFGIAPATLVFVVFRLDDPKAPGCFPGLLYGTIPTVRVDKGDVIFDLKLTESSRRLLKAATKEMPSIKWSTRNLIAADMHIVEAACLPEIVNLFQDFGRSLPATVDTPTVGNEDSLEDMKDSQDPPTPREEHGPAQDGTVQTRQQIYDRLVAEAKQNSTRINFHKLWAEALTLASTTTSCSDEGPGRSTRLLARQSKVGPRSQ